VINATTKHFSHVNSIVGSDEVWFNSGDGRYYTGSNRELHDQRPCPAASQQTAVLGVIDGTSVLIEDGPAVVGLALGGRRLQAQPDLRPQSAPVATVGNGGDTTGPTHNGLGGTGAGICGSNNGCIGVYSHQVDKDKDDHDHDRDDHDHDH